jgi:hypothetical protein
MYEYLTANKPKSTPNCFKKLTGNPISYETIIEYLVFIFAFASIRVHSWLKISLAGEH